MLSKYIVLTVVLPLATFAADDSSQLAELRRDVEILKQNQKEIQKSLLAIRDILTGKQPPLEDVFVRVSDSPALGDPGAGVVIVEFTDFQCPFCGAFARETFGKLVKEYVSTGKVRYVSRNFPLEQAHPLARKAAEAAACADEQGKYWEIHKRFFDDQQKLTIDDMPDHAFSVGMDTGSFMKCLEAGQFADKVSQDLAEGQDLNVRGTPSFFVGYTDPTDAARIRAVRSIAGGAPYREFQNAIGEALEQSKQVGVGRP